MRVSSRGWSAGGRHCETRTGDLPLNIIERYAGACDARSLKSEPSTTFSNTDVLGAAAFAARETRESETIDARPGNPLGVGLLRLFVGGDREAKGLLVLLRKMVKSKADEWGEPISWAGADLVAALALEWHRNSVCTTCSGHGFQTAVGEIGDGARVVIGDAECEDCSGSKKRSYDALFPPDRTRLAGWLRERIEAKQAAAGAEALRALAPGLGL